MRIFRAVPFQAFFFILFIGAACADSLPSWNDGPTKSRIVAFVAAAAAKGDPGYIEPDARIAVFDNDGTLWAEQPLYFQFMFVLDRVKALAPQHPEWKTQQPFKAVLDNDMATLVSDEKNLVQLLEVTHAGMTTDAFAAIVTNWIASARHPRFHLPYTDLVYQPMLELLAYLRENGFKTYIVSGGGIEFMRAFAETVYGIPPEQVIGSSGVTKFQIGVNGKPELIKEAKIDFVDDGPGKPVGIDRFIGRRPVFAFGNSDGDRQMLEWTAAGSGTRFEGLVHHTDGVREYAYDRISKIGKLDKALDEANARGWLVVDMKKDWRTIFPHAGR
jgi:phosphoglycolate phosphatase-like HAD superfamily hydrolase